MQIQHLNAGLNPRFKCAVPHLNRGFNPRFWKAGLEGLGRPGPPPYTSAAWPATAVAGRPAAWQPPPAAAAARPGRDRGHTRSPAPRPRPAAAAPAAAAGRADRNARRRHVSWSDMCSDSYSYESGSDSGPGEPTHGQRSWAQPAAAAADGWGHRGARAQRVDHDRLAQYESSPRTRALVFANWTPMGAAAPYLEVPPLIRRDAAPELRGQYIRPIPYTRFLSFWSQTLANLKPTLSKTY